MEPRTSSWAAVICSDLLCSQLLAGHCRCEAETGQQWTAGLFVPSVLLMGCGSQGRSLAVPNGHHPQPSCPQPVLTGANQGRAKNPRLRCSPWFSIQTGIPATDCPPGRGLLDRSIISRDREFPPFGICRSSLFKRRC